VRRLYVHRTFRKVNAVALPDFYILLFSRVLPRFGRVQRRQAMPDGAGRWKRIFTVSGFSATLVCMAQAHGKLPPENAKPSRSQFENLYGLMAEIKKLAPWNELWDSDTVLIYLPDAEEPTACSVMGRNGECYGIGVYPGYNSIAGLYKMADPNQNNHYSFLGYTDCINCYFGDRDELDSGDRKRLKEMGLVFRGRHSWPYFQRSRPERLPWAISGADAALLEKTLEQFIAAYKQYINDDDLTIDFENGEVLCRRYAPETQA
jgi:hypothetical protein